MTDTTTFDYTRVPRTFVHCFNNSCPRSAECLRHLAAENIPAEVRYVNIVNPRNIPAEGECPHFMPIIKVRIAWGVKELFDHVPHKEAVAMRKGGGGGFPCLSVRLGLGWNAVRPAV